MSMIKCPIRGDVKYGASVRNKDGRIHLHARKLNFIHPVKKEPVKLLLHYQMSNYGISLGFAPDVI